ncbi:putative ribonuclease H-like domain-containing protein [Tanacetum coccineum]
MDLETVQNNAVAKLPLLKQGDYEMWRLRIEQYFQIQDYALWDIIENGNSFNPITRTTTNADGTSTSAIPGPIITEEKVQKKNDVKARSMLLMALPNEHQLTFNQYKDAKTLFEAIQTRFGGNDATKKTQKTLLKQMYENFNAPSTELLDSIFNRLQKIVSQLAILVVWRNKPDLDSMSFDDLYNNFKIVEQEVKRTVTSSSNSGSQNMAFVTTPSSTNEVNTANVQVSTANSTVSTDSTLDSTANLSDATVYAFLANQPNGSQLVHEDLEQIHEDDLEEMDLKWQLALLSMRARKYYQRTGKKITINGSDTAGYDKSKVECFNCHKMGHFARECRGPRNQESRARNQDSSRRTVNVEDISSKAMVAIDGAGFDWSYMADEEVPTNLALMAFSDSEVHNTCSNTCLKSFETLKTQLDNLRVEFNKSEFNLATYKRGLASVEEQLVFYKKNEVMLYKLIGSQISDNNRKGVGYNVVPPPPTGLFAPPTIDLSNSGLKEFQQPEFKGYGFKANKIDESEVRILKSDNVQQKPKQANQPRKVSENPRNLNDKVNTAKINYVNTAKGNRVTSAVREQEINAVKSSACWTTGKEFSNPLMADSLPKTILPTKFVECLETVTVDTVNDGEQQLTVIVGGQTIAIIEASIRRHLQLADADGISSLPNTEIFDQLTLMGYVSNDDKLTFQKRVHIPLFDTMLIHDQPGQGEGPTLTIESQHTPVAFPPTSQPTTSQPMSSQE